MLIVTRAGQRTTQGDAGTTNGASTPRPRRHPPVAAARREARSHARATGVGEQQRESDDRRTARRWPIPQNGLQQAARSPSCADLVPICAASPVVRQQPRGYVLGRSNRGFVPE